MNPERPRVLLVEDDPDDVHFMKRAAAKAGLQWDLETAEDGDAAVERLSSQPRPTHVLLDLKLPKRTGLSVLAWIRSESGAPETRVIILTSSNQQPDRDEAARLGVDLYLIKPVNFAHLVDHCRVIAKEWSIAVAPAPSPRGLPPLQ